VSETSFLNYVYVKIKTNMEIKLMFIRHSKSCSNFIRELSRYNHTRNRKERIKSLSSKIQDPGLTSIGHEMAKKYGPELRIKAVDAGFDIDSATIGSSALRRAKQTVKLLFPTTQKVVVYPHTSELGLVLENTPKRPNDYSEPDWKKFLKHLKYAYPKQSDFIVVGHGSYLKDVWKKATNSSRSLHNLDSFVICGDLDDRGHLRINETTFLSYTGLVSAKGAKGECCGRSDKSAIKERGDQSPS
jgi:hypothetical protein